MEQATDKAQDFFSTLKRVEQQTQSLYFSLKGLTNSNFFEPIPTLWERLTDEERRNTKEEFREWTIDYVEKAVELADNRVAEYERALPLQPERRIELLKEYRDYYVGQLKDVYQPVRDWYLGNLLVSRDNPASIEKLEGEVYFFCYQQKRPFIEGLIMLANLYGCYYVIRRFNELLTSAEENRPPRPGSLWLKEQFSQLPTFAERIAFCTEHFGNSLGMNHAPGVATFYNEAYPINNLPQTLAEWELNNRLFYENVEQVYFLTEGEHLYEKSYPYRKARFDEQLIYAHTAAEAIEYAIRDIEKEYKFRREKDEIPTENRHFNHRELRFQARCLGKEIEYPANSNDSRLTFANYLPHIIEADHAAQFRKYLIDLRDGRILPPPAPVEKTALIEKPEQASKSKKPAARPFANFTDKLINGFTKEDLDKLLIHVRFKNKEGITLGFTKYLMHDVISGLIAKNYFESGNREIDQKALSKYLGLEETRIKVGYGATKKSIEDKVLLYLSELKKEREKNLFKSGSLNR